MSGSRAKYGPYGKKFGSCAKSCGAKTERFCVSDRIPRMGVASRDSRPLWLLPS
jgi:hypothetical protein